MNSGMLESTGCPRYTANAALAHDNPRRRSVSYEERLEAAVRKQQEHEELKTLLDVRDVQLLTEVARLFVPMLDPLDLRAFLNRAFDGDSAPSAPVPSEDFPLREKPSPGTLEDDLSILVGT